MNPCRSPVCSSVAQSVSMAAKTIIMLLFWPACSLAQVADNDMPLPVLHDAGIVVKVRHAFIPQAHLSERIRDTVSVFLIGKDGYVYTRYLSTGGYCTGKECYQYKDGHMTRKTVFGTLNPHSPFAGSNAHSHALVVEDIWAYQGEKIVMARHIAGPSKTLTRETR